MIHHTRASEKLCKGVGLLTLSDGPLRARLEHCFVYALHVLEPHNFPPELRGQFVAIQAALTWARDEQRGAIVASIEAMSDREVRRVVGLILRLADALAEHVGASMQKLRSASAAKLALNTEMTAPELAQVLRRDLPPGKLSELTDALLAKREHTANFERPVRRKQRRPVSTRRVLGLGSNNEDKP